jgi:hypothetical protein
MQSKKTEVSSSGKAYRIAQFSARIRAIKASLNLLPGMSRDTPSKGSAPLRIRLCPTCGVLVFDSKAHDRFHEAMNLGTALYDSREISIPGL